MDIARSSVVKQAPRFLLLAVGAYLFLQTSVCLWEKLFFDRLAREVSALGSPLMGKLVVVDPGHGGPDPGVVRGGVREKDITLAVARRLNHFLRQAGAEVVMTREEDRDLADPDLWDMKERKRQDLERRIALANRLQADVFLSLHVNSFEETDEYGAQTFYQAGSEESRRLAEAIQQELQSLLGNTERLPKAGDYLVGRLAQMPAVVVEIGFLTHPEEKKLLQDPAYQSKVAFAVYAGLTKFFAQGR
ncbi:N-acetylmuramoyl-L-alanine amidase [Ammonifex thiophilus]|uniref:N-acetylmuramoyl-L-alanine amidase n=1 Tax=Ammonifex thiophilus TaxID=444093 RepID=UPI001F0C80D4|nr:N-acetylmuramoyl-L-alanine amidase [Ammonifex thiophilus]